MKLVLRKRIITLSLVVASTIFLFGVVGVVQAAGDIPAGCVPTDDPITCGECINGGGTWGALGCISTDPGGLFASLVRIALGVMGGVALFRMIYLGYLYQFGDEAKIAEARQGVLATLAGVAFLVFAVLILEIIGVNILGVVDPGFFTT